MHVTNLVLSFASGMDGWIDETGRARAEAEAEVTRPSPRHPRLSAVPGLALRLPTYRGFHLTFSTPSSHPHHFSFLISIAFSAAAAKLCQFVNSPSLRYYMCSTST